MHSLIVSDPSAGRDRIERELRTRGHEVHLAEDVDLAWRLWSEHRHPLALVAAHVKGVCTVDFCRRLQRPPVERPTLTVLLRPAAQEPRALQRFIDAGVDDWLSDDADPLHTAVRLALAERRVVRFAERQRVRDDPGRGVVSMGQERVDLDAHIRKMQKFESLGALTGGIAHDFNNLVVGILGQVSLVLADLPPEVPLHEPIHEIEAAAMRAAELTRQLLEYAGGGSRVIEQVRLSRIVTDLESLLASAVGPQVSLHLALSDDLPAVVASTADVQQVVVNLVTNASEAIGDGPGRVKVSTGAVRADTGLLERAYSAEKLPAGDYVALRVEDTGRGVDESGREALFDPFFSTKFPGRGLGLGAVLAIVRAHRGAVIVESEVTRGTVVQVLLPCAPQAAPST